MDTLFRLLYSSVAIHWRSYLMYFQLSLLPDLLSLEMVRERQEGVDDVHLNKCIEECLLMTFLTSLGLIGSSVYNAAASVIRYLYVRSSLQREINEVYKRSQFVYLSLFVTGFLCLVHVTDFYFYQATRSTMMIYHDDII